MIAVAAPSNTQLSGLSIDAKGWPCESEWTMIVGHVSRDRICVASEARL
jgi:hypothetical protein